MKPDPNEQEEQVLKLALVVCLIVFVSVLALFIKITRYKACQEAAASIICSGKPGL